MTRAPRSESQVVMDQDRGARFAGERIDAWRAWASNPEGANDYDATPWQESLDVVYSFAPPRGWYSSEIVGMHTVDCWRLNELSIVMDPADPSRPIKRKG